MRRAHRRPTEGRSRRLAAEQFRRYAGETELAHQASAPPRRPGSRDEQILLHHLDRHVANEQDVLASYARFARAEPDFVRYLVDLITEDEERHHRILREMVNRVAGDLRLEERSPSVPSVESRGADRARLREETARFLELEREDLADLEELADVLRHQRLRGLLPLLVEVMELDTRKHITMLEFIGRSTTPTH